MLNSIRKFSNMIFAKIFLFIVAIPFIFWGMGNLFQTGNLNTIVKIDKEKISTKEFINYINVYSSPEEKINSTFVEKMLSNFISAKIIESEIKNFNIVLSDDSLSKIIKNEEAFKRDNAFSRTQYEKFLITNNLNAVFFEQNMSNQIKKELLFDFISGGIVPSNFIVNINFDKINQQRDIEIIRLNEIINKETNFSEEKIVSYFNNNKKKYNEIYKTINFLEITPRNLTESDDYSNLFFEKIDKIDDLIIEGKKLNCILKNFDLGTARTFTFDKSGKNKNEDLIENFPIKMIESFFSKENNETTLTLDDNKYFIVEITKTENLQKTINDKNVRNDIIKNLRLKNARKFITELASKANNDSFKKSDFEEFSKKNNTKIEKITLKNKNDNEILKKELVDKIYTFAKNKVVVVADFELSESYLIFINEISHTSTNNDSEEYKKYYNLSKLKITSDLFNTYDSFLKNKYKIEINYKALENVKNYIK